MNVRQCHVQLFRWSFFSLSFQTCDYRLFEHICHFIHCCVVIFIFIAVTIILFDLLQLRRLCRYATFECCFGLCCVFMTLHSNCAHHRSLACNSFFRHGGPAENPTVQGGVFGSTAFESEDLKKGPQLEKCARAVLRCLAEGWIRRQSLYSKLIESKTHLQTNQVFKTTLLWKSHK